MPQVDLTRIPPYYHKYINLVESLSLNEALEKYQTELVSILSELPEELWNYRYAPGKWSIKELVQHLIDGDRVFCYRALRFARHDQTELPGFDENLFAEYSEADRRSREELLEELKSVQRSSALMFQSFSEDQLNQSGVANGNSVYVGGLGYIIAGHTRHHMQVLQERYLKKEPSS